MNFFSFIDKKPNILSGKSIKDFFNYNFYFTISVFVLVAIQRLVLYPFIADKFGSDDFGSFILFMTIVNIAIVVLPGCVNMVILRVHASFNNSEKLGLIKTGLLIIIILSLAVAVLIFAIFPRIAPLFNIKPVSHLCIFPLLIYIVFYSIRQGLLIEKQIDLKFKQIAVYNIVFGVLFLFIIPLYFAFSKMGIFWGYVFVSLIATIVILPKSKNIFRGKFKKNYLSEFSRYSPSFALISVIELSLLAASRYIISFYKNPTQVAYFFAAVSIIQILSFPFAQARTILLSFISQKKKIDEFITKDIHIIFAASMLVGIILFILGSIFGKIIISKLYGQIYYENAKVTLIILLVGQIFYILKLYLNNFILVYYKRKILNLNYLVMLILNIVINILFVPKYGIKASAFAFSFSLFISSLWWYILLIQKNWKVKYKENAS